MVLLVLGSYSGINFLWRVGAERAVLFRNTPAANLCKCEKSTLATRRARRAVSILLRAV